MECRRGWAVGSCTPPPPQLDDVPTFFFFPDMLLSVAALRNTKKSPEHLENGKGHPTLENGKGHRRLRVVKVTRRTLLGTAGTTFLPNFVPCSSDVCFLLTDSIMNA